MNSTSTWPKGDWKGGESFFTRGRSEFTRGHQVPTSGKSCNRNRSARHLRGSSSSGSAMPTLRSLLVPDMHGEQNTKQTQTTVHSLRGLGVLPDLVRRVYSFIYALIMTLSYPIDHMFPCRLFIPLRLNLATNDKIPMFTFGIHDWSTTFLCFCRAKGSWSSSLDD